MEGFPIHGIGWNGMILKVPSTPNRSRIPFPKVSLWIWDLIPEPGSAFGVILRREFLISQDFFCHQVPALDSPPKLGFSAFPKLSRPMEGRAGRWAPPLRIPRDFVAAGDDSESPWNDLGKIPPGFAWKRSRGESLDAGVWMCGSRDQLR